MSYEPSLSLARFLLSDAGADWLSRAAELPTGPESHLAGLARLRRHLSPEQAGAVWEQVRLRARAAGRFGRAGEMLFTDAGLQQTSHPLVAAHRATRLRGLGRVADLGCGLGADTLALAEAAGVVLALDRDPVRLLFARHNLGIHGLADQVGWLQADLARPPLALADLDACFCDPGRRSAAGRRAFHPEEYEPPLSRVWGRWGQAKGLAVKVAPGIDYSGLEWVDEVELVSLGGQVREAVLWCGALATPGVARRATLLPAGVSVTDAEPEDACLLRPTGRYLYEPDGAVIRAGLVRQVGARLGLHQIDPHVAYLGGGEPVQSPFVRGFEVEERLPFNLKRIRRRLQELGVGVLEIKKRGVALDPDPFRRRLKLSGAESRTLIVTRIGAEPVAFVCRRLT